MEYVIVAIISKKKKKIIKFQWKLVAMEKNIFHSFAMKKCIHFSNLSRIIIYFVCNEIENIECILFLWW